MTNRLLDLRKLPVILVIICVLIMPVTSPVAAATQFDVGDQDGTWTYSDNFYLDDYFGQSFEPGHNNIKQVDLYFCTSGAEITLYLANEFNGDVPTGEEIEGQTSATPSSGWFTFTFSSPVSVTAGGPYWLVAYDSMGYCSWYIASDNPYSDGESSFDSGYDFGFRTFYDDTVPEFDNPLLVAFITVAVSGILVLITKKKR